MEKIYLEKEKKENNFLIPSIAALGGIGALGLLSFINKDKNTGKKAVKEILSSKKTTKNNLLRKEIQEKVFYPYTSLIPEFDLPSSHYRHINKVKKVISKKAEETDKLLSNNLGVITIPPKSRLSTEDMKNINKVRQVILDDLKNDSIKSYLLQTFTTPKQDSPVLGNLESIFRHTINQSTSIRDQPRLLEQLYNYVSRDYRDLYPSINVIPIKKAPLVSPALRSSLDDLDNAIKRGDPVVDEFIKKSLLDIPPYDPRRVKIQYLPNAILSESSVLSRLANSSLRRANLTPESSELKKAGDIFYDQIYAMSNTGMSLIDKSDDVVKIGNTYYVKSPTGQLIPITRSVSSIKNSGATILPVDSNNIYHLPSFSDIRLEMLADRAKASTVSVGGYKPKNFLSNVIRTNVITPKQLGFEKLSVDFIDNFYKDLVNRQLISASEANTYKIEALSRLSNEGVSSARKYMSNFLKSIYPNASNASKLKIADILLHSTYDSIPVFRLSDYPLEIRRQIADSLKIVSEKIRYNIPMPDTRFRSIRKYVESKDFNDWIKRVRLKDRENNRRSRTKITIPNTSYTTYFSAI